MKKLLTGLLVLTTMFFVGCGESNSSTSNNSENGGMETNGEVTDVYYDIVFIQGDGNVTKRVKKGDTLTDIPQITENKVGYIAKWSVNDFTNISADANVTIVFEAIESVIYYDLGECPNATISSLTQTVKYDNEFILYVPYYETSDYEYVFVKWIEKSTQKEFVNGICDFTEDIELIAIWDKFTPSFPLS